MRISLYVVGRLKARYLREAEEDYQKRLRRMARVEVREFADEHAMRRTIDEGDKRAQLVLLDERGDTIDSATFASDILQHHRLHGGGAPLIFSIGGADGHSQELRERADRLVAFGKLTIAHRLVRLLMIEQIYRGLSILEGLPYHRGNR